MLEKLFTSKTRVKILSLLLFSNEEYHLRGIARITKTTPVYVAKELENLSKLGIINRSKKANLSIYSVDKGCSFLSELRSLFLKTDSAVLELKKQLLGKDVAFAFVFGSFASGSYGTDSDIDLFIVGEITFEKVVKALRPVEKALLREINPVVWPLKDLKKKAKDNFVRDIAKKKIIMILGKEDELRKIIG